MKIVGFILLGLLLVGATFRSGWSYSGNIKFKLNAPANATLFYVPDNAQPYYNEIPDEEPYAVHHLDVGEYLITVEGYYYLDLQ